MTITHRSNLIETITLTSNPERKVEVFFRPEEEDLPVRGNDALDKAAEDSILERLERGDIWAWFCGHVAVTTSVDGVPFVGHAYIGACSYDDRDDFMRANGDGYLRDLRDEALADLTANVKRVIKSGEAASTLLKELEGTK